MRDSLVSIKSSLNLIALPDYLRQDNLVNSKREVEICGWYWPGVDVKTSQLLLNHQAVGTFLLRDSSDPNYHYTLSVQTARGPTSVRIKLNKKGDFSLDKNDERMDLPKSHSVVDLIQGYCRGVFHRQIWVDRCSGLRHSMVDLKKPLKNDVGSLKHLCRLKLNKSPQRTDELPFSLVQFIKQYPYDL